MGWSFHNGFLLLRAVSIDRIPEGGVRKARITNLCKVVCKARRLWAGGLGEG